VDEKNASDNVGCAKVTTIVESTGETRAGKRRAGKDRRSEKKKARVVVLNEETKADEGGRKVVGEVRRETKKKQSRKEIVWLWQKKTDHERKSRWMEEVWNTR